MKVDYILVEVCFEKDSVIPFRFGSFRVNSVDELKAIIKLIEKEIKPAAPLLNNYHIKAFVSVYGIKGKDRFWYYDKLLNFRRSEK